MSHVLRLKQLVGAIGSERRKILGGWQYEKYHLSSESREGCMTWKLLIIAATAFTSSVVSARATDPVLDPAQAIVAADATRLGHQGRFAMTVLATGKLRNATYLNSEADYRSPATLTFRLAPNVAGALTKRYGTPAEEYLKGKRVTVEGIARRQLIVNSEYGRAKSFNRWTHEVYVQQPDQIIAVE